MIGAIGLAYGSGLYSIGVIGTACVLLAEVLGKYIDQFALHQGRGFSCFILLDGTTDQLRAVIDHLNQRYFKAPLKYTIYNYKDGKVTCRLFGELRPQIRPENIFEDLVWITLKLLN